MFFIKKVLIQVHIIQFGSVFPFTDEDTNKETNKFESEVKSISAGRQVSIVGPSRDHSSSTSYSSSSGARSQSQGSFGSDPSNRLSTEEIVPKIRNSTRVEIKIYKSDSDPITKKLIHHEVIHSTSNSPDKGAAAAQASEMGALLFPFASNMKGECQLLSR